MNIKKTAFKQRLNNWFQFRKKLFLMWWYEAPKSAKDLQRGIYYLKKGTPYQVGQPFVIKDPKTGKTRTRFIQNLYFNYRTGQITHRFSDKPINGLTEQFIPNKKNNL